MDIEHLGVAIAIFISAVGTALVGWYGSKKFHIGPAQETLVRTLQGVVDAQAERIKQLEQMTLDYHKRILELEVRVKELEKIVLDQASELQKLRLE